MERGIPNPFGKLQYGRLIKVTEHCYFFRNVVNTGIIITDEGVAVVDTQINAPMAKRLITAIRTITDAPIRYVINTHYHWDHWAGNDVFKEAGAEIVSSKLTRYFMESRNLRQRAFLMSRGFLIPEQHPALPDKTFEGELTLQLGPIPIHLLHLGSAETDDATTVYLPTEKCVISGDTLMTGSFPILGQPVMGEGLSDDRSWVRALKKMKALSPDHIIPGHGPLGQVSNIDFFIELLDYFVDAVVPLVEEGKSVEEMIQKIEGDLPEKYSQLPQVWGTPRYAILRIVRNMMGWQEMKPSAIPVVDPEILKVPISELEETPESFIRAAEFFEKENRIDLAVGLINEGCKKFPKDPSVWVSRGRIHIKGSRVVGSVLERADFFAEVCQSAEKALELDPNYAPAMILYGSYQAMGAFRNGDDPSEPMKLLERVLKLPLEPADEAKALFYLGICHRSMEQENQAVPLFQRALELDPSYAPARMAMMAEGEMLRVPERITAGSNKPF